MNDQNAERITHGLKLNECFVDVIRFKISTKKKKTQSFDFNEQKSKCTEKAENCVRIQWSVAMGYRPRAEIKQNDTDWFLFWFPIWYDNRILISSY